MKFALSDIFHADKRLFPKDYTYLRDGISALSKNAATFGQLAHALHHITKENSIGRSTREIERKKEWLWVYNVYVFEKGIEHANLKYIPPHCNQCNSKGTGLLLVDICYLGVAQIE